MIAELALFERGVRALELTDAGLHYLDPIDDLLLPRLASFSQAREGTDIRIETALNAERTHPPAADLSIVVGAGPWEGMCVHPLFSQSFSTACAPAYLLENPVESIADLARGTLLVREDRRDAWDRGSVERFSSGALIRLFEAEFETQEQYVLLHRPEDAERAELRELTDWIVSICRAA